MVMMMWAVSACAQAPYRITLPDGDALITEEGIYIIEPGMCERILTIEPGNVYLAGNSGSYRILDGRGKILSPVVVSMARYTGGAIIFRHDGFYGVMDMTGEILIEPIWTQIAANGDGGYLALNDSPFDNVADEIIYIDGDGIQTPSGSHTVGILPDIRHDRMPYMTTDGRYGFVDGKGNALTEPVWLYAGGFENGAAIVADEVGLGLIDAQMNSVLPCGYVFLERNEYLTAALSADGILEVYSSDGKKQLFAMEAKGCAVTISGGCVALTDQDSARLFSRDGRCIYTGSPKASFSEGLNRQIIVSDGEWGDKCVWIMDPDGSAVSEPCQQILPLAGNRYAFYTMRGATYFSEVLGGLQKSWDYDSIRYGMLDSGGREILPADCLEILAVEDDRFILVKNDGVHLSDAGGNIIKSWLLPEEDLSSSGGYE